MSSPDDGLRRAKSAAVGQRLRLRQRATATKRRLSPGQLAADVRTAAELQVTHGAKAVTESVRSHPIAVGAVAAAALAWLFRKPIGEHMLPAIEEAIDDVRAALQDAAHRVGDSDSD